MHEVSQFDQRRQQLMFRIAESQRKTQELNDMLEVVQNDWTVYYEETHKNLNQALEDNENKWIFDQTIALETQLQSSISDQEKVLAEIDIIEAQMKDATEAGAQDSQLLEIKKAAEGKLAELRKSLNQKSYLYAELLSASRILIDINE